MRFQPYRGRPQEVKLLKLPTSVLSLNWHCSPSPRNALCVEIEVCNPSLPCFLELSNNFEMPWPPTTSNGRITIWGKLWIVLTFLQFPAVLLFNLTLTRKSQRNKHKTIPRLIGDTATRWVSSHLSTAQLQYYFGTSAKSYETFIKINKLPEVIDELAGDARLLWIGSKQTDRVLLYCHGGGFLNALADFHLSLCYHLKTELESRLDGKPVGVAILEYSLAPDFSFPAQLRQLTAATQHLFSVGVQPDRLHLVGDSAGANLILQLLSHTLHPLPPDLVQPSPLVNLSKKLPGICLMSPWVAVTGDFPSSKGNAEMEWVDRDLSIATGRTFLQPIPEAQRAYVEVVKAPKDWFSGIDKITDRFFVSLGTNECLVDPINALINAFERHHPSVEVVVQEHGVHNDVLQDFFAKETKLGHITVSVDSWLESCYTK